MPSNFASRSSLRKNSSGKKKYWPVIGAALLGVSICAPLVVGNMGASVNPDEEGIRYDHPPFSGSKFSTCVRPGQYNLAAPWNNPSYYAYPAGQRTYRFYNDGSNADAAAFKVNTKDGVEMHASGVVSFYLNTDCETLRKYHENIGLKYQSWMENGVPSKGWYSMLDVYLGQSIQRAMSDATLGLNWQQLYADPKTKAEWEAKVKQLLPIYVKQSMGGDYIDKFSVTIQKPEIPTDLSDALRSAQVAAQATKAQQEKNKQVTTEIESIKQLVSVLGPDGYNTYQAIKNGKVNVIPIPQGSNVIVNGSTPGNGNNK